MSFVDGLSSTLEVVTALFRWNERIIFDWDSAHSSTVVLNIFFTSSGTDLTMLEDDVSKV